MLMQHFQNPPEAEIKSLLERVRVIAVIGLSPRPSRPSHLVASNLKRFGYRIVPVRPAVEQVLGEKAYARLDDVPDHIDMVNVFRAPQHVGVIVDDCIALGIKAIWLQDGVVNEPAAVKARAAGITVVMDRCAYRDYVHFLVARRVPGFPLPPSRRPEALIVAPHQTTRFRYRRRASGQSTASNASPRGSIQ